MNKWVPMAPCKPGQASTSSRFNVLKPSKPTTARTSQGPFIGRFPELVVLNIVSFLPVPDLPNVARGCKALARVVRDERGWEGRCKLLGLSPKEPSLPKSPAPPQRQTPRLSTSLKHRPSVSRPSHQQAHDDDFGDFSTDHNDAFEDVDFGDFGPSPNRIQSPTKSNGSHVPLSKNGFNMKSVESSLIDFDELPLPSRPGGGGKQSGFFALTPPSHPSKANGGSSNGTSSSFSYGGSLGKFEPGQWYLAYRDHHVLLVPLCRHLRSSPSPSSTLALLFPAPASTTLTQQSTTLLKLLLFLSPSLQPLRDWGFLRQALLAASDRFDSTCLVAFEMADSKSDTEGMRIAAEASWNVWEAGSGTREQWECGRVWVEKREVFYETSKWDALENIVKVQTPSGATVKQLDFTPMDAFISHVLETFKLDAEIATRVFPPSARVVLSFCERVANDVIGEYIQPLLSQARVISLDIFLQATAASFVQSWKLVDVAMAVLGKDSPISRTIIEDVIYRMFEVHMDEYLEEETEYVKQALETICRTWDQQLGASEESKRNHTSGPTFLNASNPDQVKRNVLAGFKDVLLLPVTIVPRTVTFGVNAIVSGGSQAVSGLAMLNPQKWAGSAGAGAPQLVKDKDGDVIFDLPVDDEKDDELVFDEKRSSASSTLAPPLTATSSQAITPTATNSAKKQSFDKLQLLVSLDVALELLHADRDALKRTETFANYPGKYGHRVCETIEEIFILMLKSAADRHIAPGFRIATNQMSAYKPAEHEETKSVAPLLQFFELVHVGDTIQSMVQVYFDQELTKYVDKTDFLNAVMREKKRFESVLDDAVAAGLNAGIEVLMNQVEHIIMVKTGPREYYPDDSKPMDLGATEGCKEAIACLEMHCNLLKGSTSKEVLEVFYQEVGIRLQQILQRHLKRQIISLSGGFQIIADLNAYHAFVSSLKQQRITDDFANVKMLGHVYIVSDAKDLAQIVRDVTRYGGTFTPEDIYEFIQRRADWKKIEKTVDKAMYALSVKEDCVIM